MWHMGDGWGWWMVFGWIWMAVFWGLIIWAVYSIITRVGGGRRPELGEREPSALEILDRRYARGEIDAEQFEAMRGRLTAPAGANQTPSDGLTVG
jgi:putative membrane protein